MKQRIIYCVCILLISNTLLAQNDTVITKDTKIWTLKECMLFAVDNSRKIKIQKANNDNKRLDHRDAYLKWIPSISGSSSATTNFGRSIDPETNIYTNTTSFSNNYSLMGDFTIFNGFSTVNNYKITKIANLSGIEEYRQIEDDICLKTIQAFFNVLYMDGMEKITLEQLNESKQNLHRTKVMEELGIKGHADLLQVEAKMASDDFLHVKAKNNLADAILTLKGIMYFPMDDDIEIDTNMIWLVDPYFKSRESADSLFDIAQHFLPSIKKAEYEFKSAKLRYNTAIWQILPKIYVQGGYSTSYMTYLGANKSNIPFFTQLGNNSGEYIGIGMNIPIFNSLSKQSERVKRRNMMKIAEFQKEEKLQEVETEIRRAIQDMEGAAKEYIQSDKRAMAQEIAHKANVQKYNEGLISVLDLQTSSNQLLTAKAEKLNTALTYLIKTKVVNYYKGIHYLDQ